MSRSFNNYSSQHVDGIITGGESEDEGFNLYSQAKEMFRTGGFNLRKFLTNSRALQEQIDRAEGLKLPTMEDAHCIEETYAEATLGGLQYTDVGSTRFWECPGTQIAISS